MHSAEYKATWSGNYDCVWLFGRGASLAAGLDWDETVEIESMVDRGLRTEAIRSGLRGAQDAVPNNRVFEAFMERICSGTIAPWTHCFATLNWDTLLQSAVDGALRGRGHQRIWDSQVRHLNGSIDSPDDQWSAHIILRKDTIGSRKLSPELNTGLSELAIAKIVVIVGVSLAYGVDQALFNTLSACADEMPIGDTYFLIIDLSPSAVAEKLRGLFRTAIVQPITIGFGDWVGKGMPELVERGVLRPV